jgi:TolB-like protein
MFTDIVGYTAMMQQNEETAVAVIKHYNASLEKWVSHFNGQVLNYYGDGSLCIFSSATDAVNCSLAVQKELKNEPAVPLRIGLHIGEVFFEDAKALGDGVNVASRVQSLGQENTILISEEVHDKIKNNASVTATSLGRFDFKNVGKSMEVFALTNEGLFVPQRKKMEGKLRKKDVQKRTVIIAFLTVLFITVLLYVYKTSLTKNNKSEVAEKSIAVLPFVNMSNDIQQEYFSDGMMDEIMNHLYKIGGLRVISRTTSMTYKGSKKTLKEIANEMGVANLLEGSVLKDGDRIRIIVQLIDGKTDQHLWAETYQREFKDVFSIQSDIAREVAMALKIELDPEIKKRIEYTPTDNLSAYDLYLKAMAKVTKADWINIEKMLEEVVSLDSSFAPAYATLGLCWILKGGFGGTLTSGEILEHALPLLKKAAELDENLSSPHSYLAYTYLWFRWDFEAAGKEWQKFFQLGPSTSSEDYLGGYPDYLLASERFREAFEFSKNVVASNKYNVIAWYSLAQYYYFTQQHDSALTTIEKCSKLFGFNDWLLQPIANINTLAHRYIENIVYLENYLNDFRNSRSPFVLSHLSIAYLKTGQKEKSEKIVEEIKLKSKKSPVGSPSFYIAAVYTASGQKSIALQWLEKGYMDHELEMYWLKAEPLFKFLQDEPKFKELLKKIGFK